jgi:tetratricopeptide (TPR) repeat protein
MFHIKLFFLLSLFFILIEHSPSQIDEEKSIKLRYINSLALKHVREGDLEKAIETLFEGLKIWDESPEINYNIGMLYFDLGKFQEAEKYAIRATKYKYKWERKNAIYGTGLRSPKEVFYKETTIKEWSFENALEMGNDFLEAYDLLGNIYFKKGEFEKSVKAFRKVIEIDPRDALGYYNLGCSYFGMKRYEEAERSWKDAIKYDRRKGERGEEVVEERGEMPRVSVTILKRTVSFHSYKSLGSLYKESGEIEKAIESYIRAIELFPTDAECYYELGKLYIERGEKEKAIKCLEKYLEHGTEKEGEVRELLKRLKGKSLGSAVN